jgi:hypothetical protein
VLDERSLPPMPVHVVMTSRLVPARVRLFVDFLASRVTVSREGARMTRQASSTAGRRRMIFAMLALVGLPVGAFAQEAIAPPAPIAPLALQPPADDAVANPDRSEAPDQTEWWAETEAARERHAEWLSCVLARRFKCNAGSVSGPMDALLADETLVAGDVVSTPHGLKVFRGRPQTPHRWADFQ